MGALRELGRDGIWQCSSGEGRADKLGGMAIEGEFGVEVDSEVADK